MRQKLSYRPFPLWAGVPLSALILVGALLWMVQIGPSVQAESGQVAISHDGDSGEEEEIEGMVVARPADTRLGNWEIQSERHRTVVVVADANTNFKWGDPQVGDFVKARYRVQSDGTLLATRLRLDKYEAGEVIVRLADGVSADTIAERYDLSSIQTLLASGNIYRFRTGDEDDDVDDLTTHLNADPDVIWAELNYVGGVLEGHPYKIWHWGGSDNSGYINQAAYEQVDLAPAWLHARGAGETIAVLDTGVDFNHQALTDRLLSGWDMVADDNLPQDEGPGLAWGHGTHVAGIIAHIAAESQILPVRVLDSNGLGNTFTLAYAVEWAVQHRATVINLSLGTDADSHVLRAALQYAVDQGVIVVAAAGNNNNDSQQFPVSYPDVIGVTAVDAYNVKADFANFGSAWVDLAAPGVGITSTFIGEQGSGYASWSGTSMSTAFVSGAAALVHEMAPTNSVADTLELLQEHGIDLDGANPTLTGQIGDLLDIGATINFLATGSDATPTPTPTATPTLSETAHPTPSATPSPTPSATQVATATPTPTATLPTAGGSLSVRLYLPLVVR